jgi:hypothetical protein
MLNSPMAVLVVLAVVVAVNAFLFFGYYLPNITSPGAPISTPAPTSVPTTTTSTATSSP